MNYEKIKKKVLKEKDVHRLVELIEKYNLQDDKDVKEHFRKIDIEDTIEYSLYNRKKYWLNSSHILMKRMWK